MVACLIAGLLVAPALPARATTPSEPEKLLIGRWEPMQLPYPDEGDADLWIADYEGTPLRRLTQTPNRDESPGQWAPHGHWIAFESGPWYGDCDVQIIRPDGSGKRTVAGGVANDYSPTWSPDGRWLAWVHVRPGTSIETLRIAHPDGSAARTIRVPEHSIWNPTWSPLGDRIAFTSYLHEDGSGEIFTVRPDGSDLTRLTTSRVGEYILDWSPNGKKLLFAHYGIVNQLSTMFANGRRHPQTVLEGTVYGARYAPSGGLIAYEAAEGGSHGFDALWNVTPDGPAVKVLAFDGYTWVDSSQCS